MALHRRAAKRDSNEAEIIRVLHAHGCSVQPLSGKGVPDLLVGWKGKHLALVEVKAPRGKLTEDQQRWRARWGGPPPRIIRSVDEAIHWLRAVGAEWEP